MALENLHQDKTADLSKTGLKKTYTAPAVLVHGTVAEITAKLGETPDADGGSFVPDAGTN